MAERYLWQDLDLDTWFGTGALDPASWFDVDRTSSTSIATTTPVVVQSPAPVTTGFPSASCSFASLPTIGNYVMVLATTNPNYGTAATGFTVTDNQSGHTYDVTSAVGQGNACCIAWVKVSASTGTFTVTARPTPTGADCGVTIKLLEVSGLAASSVVDQTVTVNNELLDPPFNVTTGVTDTAQELCLAVLAPASFQALNSVTPPGTDVELFDLPSGDGAGYMLSRIISASAAQNINFSPNVTTQNGSKSMVVKTFRAAPMGASSLTAATGTATTSTLAGTALTVSALTQAAGTSATTTLVGTATQAAALTPAAGAGSTSSLGGVSVAAAAQTAASGTSTTSTLAGTSSAAAALTPAPGLATTSLLTGTSSAVSAFTSATGTSTTSTLAAAGGTASAFTTAAGSSATSTLAGKSTAAATTTAATGTASTASFAGTSTAASAFTAAAGTSTTSTRGGASSATSTFSPAAGTSASLTMLSSGTTVVFGSIVPATGNSTTSALLATTTLIASFVPAAGTSTTRTLSSPVQEQPGGGGGGRSLGSRGWHRVRPVEPEDTSAEDEDLVIEAESEVAAPLPEPPSLVVEPSREAIDALTKVLQPLAPPPLSIDLESIKAAMQADALARQLAEEEEALLLLLAAHAAQRRRPFQRGARLVQ